jgi:hypothetical protein
MFLRSVSASSALANSPRSLIARKGTFAHLCAIVLSEEAMAQVFSKASAELRPECTSVIRELLDRD